MGRVMRFLGAAFVAVLLSVVAGSSPALADTSQIFTTPGHTTFTVPSGVNFVTFTVYGASGGNGGGSGATPCTAGGSGALGSKVVYTAAVTPGQIYDLYVGARGANGACGDAGGAGGAGGVGGTGDTNGAAGGAGATNGTAGTDLGGGGGGGGGSDVRQSSTEIVGAAGGGGGGAGAAIGGAGGVGGGNSTTGKGANSTGAAQGGGAGSAGGSGGSSGGGPAGTSGTAHAGGAAGTATDTTNGAGGGGGGGGGYYGGGGGGQAGTNTDGGGGGGGGEGGILSTSGSGQTAGVDPGNNGDGEIVVTYVAPPVTGSASSITNTTATINGTDSNADTSNGDMYHFDYGTTMSYGTSTSDAPSTTGNLSADLTGLSPGTTYHFRIVSSEGGDGADATFTTPALPPPVTGTAIAITATGATLQGTDPNSDTYHFEYGTDTTYGTSTADVPATSGTLSATVTGLTPGTTYHFRIVSSGGGDGLDATFTTLSTPVTGSATAVTATGATLQGTDVNTGESYHFDYGTSLSYGTSTPSGTAASGTLTAVLTGLTPGTTYHFRIFGDSGAGSDATFTTGVPPVTGSAVSVGATGATLEGTDGNAGESYHFEYGTTTSYGQSTAAKTAAAGTLKAAVAGLKPNTTYHFRIVGDAGAGSDATFTTTIYDAKLGLTGPKSGKVGKKLTYKLTFTNTGTGPIARPFAEIRFTGAKLKVLTKSGCTKSSGGYLCKYAGLAPGKSASATIVISGVKPGKVRMLASIIVVGNLIDPTRGDDARVLVTSIHR
ncbi:MAG TPA: fibronectin type III domain-containing protein [Gaiellaceae bacterium]|nr:fibronectin type III domain-containing protein [Gaiellaceae bacterium]